MNTGKPPEKPSIGPWLPRHLVERRTPLPDPGAEEVFTGTLLRLDIRDFSTRPDRVLGDSRARKHEHAAAEDLAEAVEDAFRPIFYAVDRHGGSIASLEGDAVLALFRGPGHPLRARSAMDDVLALRPTLHAAVATGEIHALQLEGGEQRHELVHGPALLALERLEEDSAIVAIGNAEDGPASGGFCTPPDDVLLRFVPPSLRGLAPPAPVHRRVVACFVAAPVADAPALYRALAEESETHGNLLLKVRAEGENVVCLVLTGAPSAQQDDAHRALQHAVSVRDRLVDTENVKPRLALVDGTVLALVLGDGSRLAWDVVGDAVNVAYRLLGEARPGDVVAASTLVDAVREAVAGPSEAVTVRGKTRPIAVRRVTGMAIVRRETPDGIYPRRKELAHFDAMITGNRPVAVVAAAGMGKRYLWQEWSARNPGWRVLRATCRDHGAIRPMQPFVGLVRRLGGDAPTRAALAATLSSLPGMDDRATAVLDAFVNAGAPQIGAVTAALRQLIGGLAAAGNCLLVVEDIQWADADVVQLLSRLISDTPRTPLRVALTARPRTALPAGVALIDLLPIPPDAARALVAQLVGDPPLSPVLAERIVHRAGGSPREIVALVDAARQGDDELPESLESWYAARIDALDAPAREVLERAAILGRTVDRGLLRRLAADVPRAEDGLRTLFDARLLASDDAGSRIAFDREATREIAYMRMTSARRRQLHTRVGRVLQARSSAGSPVAPEVLAWHLARSDAPAEALAPLVEASRRALAHGRPRLALSHAEQAARIARSHRPEALAEVQRSLGDAMLALGRSDLALEAFKSIGDPTLTVEVAAALAAAGFARDALRAVNDVPGAMAAAVRARALSLLGDPLAEQAHAAALAAAGTLEEKARALRFYGADLSRDDRFPEATEVLEEAVRAAQRAGDPLGRADALDLLGGVLGLRGELDRALTSHRSALVIREALGQPDGIAATLRRLGRAESRRGEGGRALGHLVAARALLRDAGLESRLARIEVELAEVRWRRSEPDHARRHLGAASDLSGRALARHALLSALVAPRDQVLALARKAVAACERDRWRSGQLLAGALAAFVEQDVARLGAALADLERVGHAEFARLSRQWNEALEGAEETEEIDLGPR